MVQVIVGENKGEGVRVGSRCLWDAATDGMAHESMTTVSTRPRRWPCLLPGHQAAAVARLPARPVRRPSQDKVFVTAMAFGVYLY